MIDLEYMNVVCVCIDYSLMYSVLNLFSCLTVQQR